MMYKKLFVITFPNLSFRKKETSMPVNTTKNRGFAAAR